MSALKVKHLEKELGYQKTLILKDLNFEIESGEFVALVGKSGSGKSTLLYILSTLDEPTRGEIYYNDKNIVSMTDREIHILRNQKIGFIFQFHYLLSDISALENILMPSRKHKMYEQKKKKAYELLEIMGMTEHAHKLPRELSGGQAQRVAIARSLIMDPLFLFADEPTGSLDSTNSKMIFDIFKKINAEFKTTIVMVTHDVDLANATSRQIKLVDGALAK